MTLIIAEQFQDCILVVSDMRRTSVEEKTKGSITNEKVKKVQMVYPGIGIATGGLGDLGDTVTQGILSTFKGAKNVPISRILETCEAYFNFVHGEFIKFQPEYTSVGLSFLVFGLDTTAGTYFMYAYDSRNRFERTLCYPSVALGSGSIKAIELIGTKSFDDSNTAASEYVKVVREVSKNNSSVGSDVRCVLIGKGVYREFELDENDNHLLPMSVYTWE